MQEQINHIGLSDLLCKNNKHARLLCCSQNCKSCALVCRNEDCNCLSSAHKYCDFTYTESLITRIADKKGVLPEQVHKAIVAIDNLYQESIQQLSRDRQALQIWKQNFGLTIQEAKLLDMLKLQNTTQLTGEFVFSIKQNIQTKQNIQWLTQSWVETFWNKEKPQFDRIFDKINKLGQSQAMKRKYFDSVITLQGEKIRSYFDRKISSFDLLYRASENDHSIQKFYENCSGVSDTMVIIRTQHDRIIGGFTPLPWKKPINEEYLKDASKSSFIFSLTNDQKFPLVRESDAIKYQTGWGPIFGGSNGWDISVPDKGKNMNGGIFNFPASYNNGKYSSNQEGHKALAGVSSGYYSHISDWQVFKVHFNDK